MPSRVRPPSTARRSVAPLTRSSPPLPPARGRARRPSRAALTTPWKSTPLMRRALQHTKGDSGSGQRKGHSEKQERQRRDCEEAVRMAFVATRLRSSRAARLTTTPKRSAASRSERVTLIRKAAGSSSPGSSPGSSSVPIRWSIAIAPTVRAETATPMPPSLDIRRIATWFLTIPQCFCKHARQGASALPHRCKTAARLLWKTCAGCDLSGYSTASQLKLKCLPLT
jgi:hypothetical protein